MVLKGLLDDDRDGTSRVSDIRRADFETTDRVCKIDLRIVVVDKAIIAERYGVDGSCELQVQNTLAPFEDPFSCLAASLSLPLSLSLSLSSLFPLVQVVQVV